MFSGLLRSTLFLFFLIAVGFANASTDFYTLSYRNDPATTAVIGWSGDNGTVHYGTVDEGTNFAAYPLSHASDRTGGAHNITRHFARLTGLTPNTIYYFVIHDQAGATSQRFYFRTLSDDPNDPVSFISGGDTRDGFKVFGIYTENCPSGDCLQERREGNILVSMIRPDFVAFTGDFVMNQITSNTQSEWSTWLSDWQLTITSDGRLFPMTFSRGNHEDVQDCYEMFDIPTEEFYSLNIHGGLIRLYMLNTELDACNDLIQLNWLTNDLQSNTGPGNDPYWKFASHHVPTLAMGKDGALESDQMQCWVNLFEQYKVRLVMESDSHSTKWTYPCVANASNTDFQTDMQNGVVYIGEGQWGAPHRDLVYTGANAKPYVRDQGVFDNFFFIRVTKEQTSIKCVEFENIGSVIPNTANDLGGMLPSNVVLWTPSNGDEVILTNQIDVTDIDEQQFQTTSVYPSIVEEAVTVEFEEVQSATIELYNSLGKLCKSDRVENVKTFDFNVKNACKGIAYLYIKMDNGVTESHRIVIK